MYHEKPRRKLATLLPAAVTAALKAKVAFEALKEKQTLAELAEKFELHPNQISQRKQEFIAGSEQVFESGKGTPGRQSRERSGNASGSQRTLHKDWLATDGARFSKKSLAKWDQLK